MISLFLSVPLLAVGQDPGTATVERHLSTMGTSLAIEVAAETRADALSASERAVRALETVEARLSTWRAESELARFNRAPVGERFQLTSELAADLARASRWWRATGGAFDPGVGALVEAWGLRSGGREPDADVLADARGATGLARIELDGRGARRLHTGVTIEEGGFGKGVGLDAAVAALRDAGATSAALDLGGQVALFGAEPIAWAIADPRDRERAVVTLTLSCGSFATTGNSERGFQVDGRRFGHVLDPRTGEPARDFGSVTVVASNATDADCLSTGLFVLGPEAALAWATEHDGIDVLVLEVAEDGLRARATEGLRDRLAPVHGDGRGIEIELTVTRKGMETAR